MSKATDIRVRHVALHFLPVPMRVPLKFGTETIDRMATMRVRVEVADRAGRRAARWGETPVAVTWVWPGGLSFEARENRMRDFAGEIGAALAEFGRRGHPIEIGHGFVDEVLPGLRAAHNRDRADEAPMPWLAALVAFSAFDIAVHDAFGVCHERPVYETYGPELMNEDLAAYLAPAHGADISFAGRYPADFLAADPPTSLPAWHLVGGVDPLGPGEATGAEPDDGYPVFLGDWIETDGLDCLKIKLRGDDARWDHRRTVAVGELAIEKGVRWLSTDFNCTVTEPGYVNQALDRLRDEHPRIYGMILYVEQPFPYRLEDHRIDVHSVAARKPLFMDESAHDWKYVRMGRELGWSGVALKTCKTQTGALLSQAWAAAHGMPLMVQDLTNPMLAMIPHVQLAARAGTIMGVEVNAMQFYPEASRAEMAVHPGLYRRRGGRLDLSTLRGPGFGYRLDAIERALPEPAAIFGER